MPSTKTDHTIVLDSGRSEAVFAVAFHPDGMHLFGGSDDGIRRWRLPGGQEVGKQTGMQLSAIAVSRDHKWVVCGTLEGASVWDAELQEKVIDVEGKSRVKAVDISPDSTRFATEAGYEASIWSITTGERLVGPLKPGGSVAGIKFSPNGEHIATACYRGSIRIFDSRNGDELKNIETITPSTVVPLAWSNDGRQIFAPSDNRKTRSFDVSTGSQLAESQINGSYSIALAANGKFIAVDADYSVAFLDTLTMTQIGHVIEDSNRIWSIALSSDNSYLATGRYDGKIAVHNLSNILPDLYGPFHASTPEEQQAEQPSTSGGHDNKPPDSNPKEPVKSNRVESETHGKDSDSDLLEVELPSSMPSPLFDYDEPSLTCSAHPREDEVPPVGSSHVISRLSEALPAASLPEVDPGEYVDIIEPSHGLPMLRKWLHTRIKKSNKDGVSYKPDQLFRKSRRHADHQPRSQSPARVNATLERPPTMAEGKRKRRAVAKAFQVPQRKSPAKAAVPNHPNKDTPRSGQGAAGPREASPAQQVNDAPQPSAGRVRVTHQRESGDAFISIRLPARMLCFRSGTEDGTH